MYFNAYYAKTEKGYGILINKVWLLNEALSLTQLRQTIPGFHPPQNYKYLKFKGLNILNSGNVINSKVSNIDLLPSVLELIEAKIPENIEGKSFLSILKGEKKELRKEVYVEQTYHDIYNPMRCIRTDNYKYIKNFEKWDILFEIPEDMRDMARMGGVFMNDFPELYKKERMMEELYDLEKDPNERNNIINDPDYKDIATDLREKLEKWMKRTKDPLLEGKIKHPDDK